MESEERNSDVEAMRRATILLDTTRDNIMSGVKQNVEKNMMQFLPTLTDNRYNMARIDETNYRIEVYDREAKQWRGKGVFSGATQDQFSLALRLAFAISTIPSSRGARPGFIFLDEPLSGFDAQRRIRIHAAPQRRPIKTLRPDNRNQPHRGTGRGVP